MKVESIAWISEFLTIATRNHTATMFLGSVDVTVAIRYIQTELVSADMDKNAIMIILVVTPPYLAGLFVTISTF